jgi:hypothetical protein
MIIPAITPRQALQHTVKREAGYCEVFRELPVTPPCVSTE